MTRIGSAAVPLFAATAALLAAGGLAELAAAPAVARGTWTAAAAVGVVYSTTVLTTSVRRGVVSVDLIAVLALAGAIAVGEELAGAVIAFMVATGAILEARADRRARRDLSLLVSRAPTSARRIADGTITVTPLADIAPGDRLMIGAGELVPVDGRIVTSALFDESALTGEPLPVEHSAGDDIRSGVVNAGAAVELIATAAAADSTYSAIVRLVEQTEAASAPFVRFADRIAIAFVPFTLATAGLAWAFAGSAARAVAVLVVATPCPLLLAAPIAVMSGLSRAARRGVIVKGGGSLERLADGRTVLLDKTGTVTLGRPELSATVSAPGVDGRDMLALAASVEQVSPHVIAGGIVSAARRRGLELSVPATVREQHGYGIEGTVDGRTVRVGKAAWILGAEPPAWASRAHRRADLDDSLIVFVGIDGAPAGALLLQDRVRPDAPRMVRALRRAGIARVVLLTGDRADVAATVGRVIGVDDVRADCDPGDKLATVTDESGRMPTVMVGDGINDAPALAAAGAGVALAARGATASSEAADVVLAVDRLDALADAIAIARRSRRIAWRAAAVGMSLSGVGMGISAVGWLPATAGAVLQEFIDVVAIGIALSAAVPVRGHRRALPPGDAEAVARQRAVHQGVLAIVDEVRDAADGLSGVPEGVDACYGLLDRLEQDLIPHERRDDEILVPIAARELGGVETTAALSRAHAEIVHQVSVLHRLLDDLRQRPAEAADVVELRRLLYGLYAVLRLHNDMEDETMSALAGVEAT